MLQQVKTVLVADPRASVDSDRAQNTCMSSADIGNKVVNDRPSPSGRIAVLGYKTDVGFTDA
ncbi:hypothetical protein GCM10022252_45720 [Streptosporangium oxazolinicum]|uniref:Uncharacterized protein n=1 Tax=Streptosporangium oxazolinicum TaxID=909287 RepID=A0ABP8B3G2_9ACTN